MTLCASIVSSTQRTKWSRFLVTLVQFRTDLIQTIKPLTSLERKQKARLFSTKTSFKFTLKMANLFAESQKLLLLESPMASGSSSH